MTMTVEAGDRTDDYEALLKSSGGEHYFLRLYVSGMTLRSAEAITRTRAVCEEYLHGRYKLEVIDIHQQPHLARNDQIVAAPTLLKKLPPPLRRLVGDLSDAERVLVGLDLRRKE